jgi:hypothetical protein
MLGTEQGHPAEYVPVSSCGGSFQTFKDPNQWRDGQHQRRMEASSGSLGGVASLLEAPLTSQPRSLFERDGVGVLHGETFGKPGAPPQRVPLADAPHLPLHPFRRLGFDQRVGLRFKKAPGRAAEVHSHSPVHDRGGKCRDSQSLPVSLCAAQLCKEHAASPGSRILRDVDRMLLRG